MKLIHNLNDPSINEQHFKAKSKLPLHKDPKYLANLKRDLVAMHNEKIRKQKLMPKKR